MCYGTDDEHLFDTDNRAWPHLRDVTSEHFDPIIHATPALPDAEALPTTQRARIPRIEALRRSERS
ncbi:hypothetical protein ACIOBK_02000 [Micromonospora chokoriensis]